MKTNTKISLLTLATLGSFLFSSLGQATDLTATDSDPEVIFDDTDATGVEWLIGGDATQFVVHDSNTDSNVFRIYPGTSNNINEGSITVEPNGDVSLANETVYVDKNPGDARIGIGTASPQAAIHVKSGNIGNIILQSPEANWEISTLLNQGLGLQNLINDNVPFRIDGTAPTDSVRLSPTGVGIGIVAPTAKLDVAGDIKATFQGSGGSLQTLFKMSADNTNSANRSDVGFVLENVRENFSWAFRTLEDVDNVEGTTGFAISKQNTGGREFVLINNTSNDAEKVELHLGSGASNVNGQWENASSRSYKKNIHELSSENAMQAMRGLKSVTYQFKRDTGNEKMIGFIAEDIPELLATNSRKTVDPLRIIAVLTKAVQEQDKSLLNTKMTIELKSKKITELENNTKILRERLNKIEALLFKK